jgi:catechol 2,3-dioxygenase-like lactoylglutathione lyase family enzyme
MTKERAVAGSLSWPEKVTRKVIAIGGKMFFAAAPLLYRLRFPWGGKLGHVDHVTIPTADLRIAEEFYVGLLGARIVLRIDQATLTRMGWTLDEIERNHAVHLSVTLGGGPRLDLFEYPFGIPPEPAMHPHIALTVAPGKLLPWKKRLMDRGVVVAGPTRAGPPGQASIYFNDPFGNHLELVTIGFVDEQIAIGMPDRSKLNYAWQSRS